MLEQKNKTASAVCSGCGGHINLDESKEFVECPYCGTKYAVSDLLDESDAVKIEKIKTQAYKEIESEKIKYEIEKDKHLEEKSSLNEFKKSKFSKVLIVFAVIGALFCAVSFSNGKILSGLVAVVMTALFIISYLMGMQVIKEKKKGIRTLAAILAFIMIIPYFGLYNLNSYPSNNEEKFSWKDDIVLCDMLPEPESNTGEIYSNSETNLSIRLSDYTAKKYSSYINACKDKGYKIDSEEDSNSYCAYNKEGYKLDLSYYDSLRELSIDLDAPMKMGKIQWPEDGLAQLIPAPKSNEGNIEKNSETGFIAYVGSTLIDDYTEYIEKCSEKGFNINKEKTDKHYFAKNKDGYKLTVDYQGNNVICIKINEPEYNIKIEVTCEENLIFSKYDVKMLVDDLNQGTIKHGEKQSFTLSLKKGSHTVKFESDEDSDVTGEIKEEITKDDIIKLKISCTNTKIEVENLSEQETTENLTSSATEKETEVTNTEEKPSSSNVSSDIESSKVESSKVESSKVESSKVESNNTPIYSDNNNSKKNTTMVWVSSSGKKYHSKSSCSGMKDPYQITIEEAESMGYTPCSKCH